MTAIKRIQVWFIALSQQKYYDHSLHVFLIYDVISWAWEILEMQ